MFTYKGYVGTVEIDYEDSVLVGRVLDIKDVITFEGKTLEEAEKEFQNSVDDYLEFCQELGRAPNKPFSGKLAYRTSPESHRKIYLAAYRSGSSINSWMDKVLNAAADHDLIGVL